MTSLNGLSSMATRLVLADLANAHERQTGDRIAIRSMGGVEAARLVRAGKATDVVILAAAVMETLEVEGHLVAGSRTDFARSGIAMAVRAGAPRPDIRDESAVKSAMLAAKNVCYSTGPSGDHLKALWNRWGIADVVSSRALQAPPGVPVGELIARGEADFGFQQLSELLPVAGIEVLGPLPPSIQQITTFVAAISAASSKPDSTHRFIAYLASPDAHADIRRHGMEPA